MFKKPTAPIAVKLTQLNCDEVVHGENVAIPLATVEEVKKRFENTLYGYFIRKRLAFPVKSWGRNTYARALVEVSSFTALKDSLIVAIPFPDVSGHSPETVEIEYEWQL
ncbi:hypothetical protein Tco_0830098 [Tanacetum coccineum]